jgi:flagellar L-ring protein precursor FlgH
MQTSSSKAVRALPLVAIALLCSGYRDKKPNPYAVSYPEASIAAPAGNGSIFQASQGYAALTSGYRAARVGDILTVSLVERTQAQKTTGANMGKSGSISITPPTTGPLGFFNATDAKVAGDQSFDGKGQAVQSNSLVGEISVTVAEVYPNGNMLVRGEKLLTLNRGDEFIRISGIVRPVDIGPDNRIASARLADARVTYSGKGEIARAARQGWLTKFFSMLSPF